MRNLYLSRILNVGKKYIPKSRDSHAEVVRPEDAFLEFFKQSLSYTSPYCTDPTCCTFFDLGSQPSTASQQSCSSDICTAAGGVNYPLVLFEDLEDLPPVSLLHHWASHFHARILPSIPFLRDLSILSPAYTDVPFYLLVCKALIGASTLGDEERQLLWPMDRLFKASVSLVTGTVEVDNGLGTRLAGLTSVCKRGCLCQKLIGHAEL